MRHVFFDFDQTISRIHVFKQLAGWEPGVAPPHALSERGQICRIDALTTVGPWVYDVPAQRVVEASSGATWASAALGGPGRVQQLRRLFAALRASGVKMTIITRGYVGAVQRVLAEDDLLVYFDAVHGSLGNFYGENLFDRQHSQPTSFDGAASSALAGSKAQLIASLLWQEGLSEPEAMLVEDDSDELESVNGICRGLFVVARSGITEFDMDRIRDMLTLPSELGCAGDVDVAMRLLGRSPSACLERALHDAEEARRAQQDRDTDVVRRLMEQGG